MPDDYLPKDEAQLTVFSNAFDTNINALNTAIGLTLAQCTGFTALNDEWNLRYSAVQNGNNSTPNIVLKNQAKANLVSGPGGIRELVGIIQKHPGTTDAQRATLNITIPDLEPSPIPAPGFAPKLDVISTDGRVVRFQMSDPQTPDSKAMPPGVDGAVVMSWIGPNPPTTHTTGYQLQGTITRTRGSLMLPETVTPGTEAYLIAMWFNRRGMGPACNPVALTINYPNSIPAAG